MPRITVNVDGDQYDDDVQPRTLLVHYLREQLGKVGTVIGCDTTNCGACTVHLDGRSVKSCSVLAVQADGHDVTTIEGLSRGDELHPLQQAFHENHALQCGFCTPGMIMQSLDLLAETPEPDDDQVREGLEGNLCRCTGYQNIVRAVRDASERMRPAAQEPMTQQPMTQEPMTQQSMSREGMEREAPAQRTPTEQADPTATGGPQA